MRFQQSSISALAGEVSGDFDRAVNSAGWLGGFRFSTT
jgi:hypothetical protein